MREPSQNNRPCALAQQAKEIDDAGCSVAGNQCRLRHLYLGENVFLKASVIIATRDRPVNLRECLQAVSRQKCSSSFETLVVDNAPSDDRSREIALHAGVRYIVEPRPGHCCARNAGARHAAGEIVAYLDDDSIPDSEWLENLLKPFADPCVMVVTGRVKVYWEENGTRTPLAEHSYDAGTDAKRIDRKDSDWYAQSNFDGIGVGANMAFRRTFFEEFGGFDERLGRGGPLGGFDESHAFFRIVAAGHALVYTPDAAVQHPCRTFIPGSDISRTAYMTMLLCEYPRHAVKLFRYVVHRIGKLERAPMRANWTLLGARLLGPFQYLKVRLRTSRVEPGVVKATAPPTTQPSK